MKLLLFFPLSCFAWSNAPLVYLTRTHQATFPPAKSLIQCRRFSSGLKYRLNEGDDFESTTREQRPNPKRTIESDYVRLRKGEKRMSTRTLSHQREQRIRSNQQRRRNVENKGEDETSKFYNKRREMHDRDIEEYESDYHQRQRGIWRHDDSSFRFQRPNSRDKGVNMKEMAASIVRAQLPQIVFCCLFILLCAMSIES